MRNGFASFPWVQSLGILSTAMTISTFTLDFTNSGFLPLPAGGPVFGGGHVDVTYLLKGVEGNSDLGTQEQTLKQ